MATRQANVKGMNVLRESQGTGVAPTVAFLCEVSFDLLNLAYTGGADSVQLGGGGQDNYTATTLTLAQLIQNHRRTGRTIALISVAAGLAAGQQTAATNGPYIWCQSVAISTSNVTLNLFSALTGGSAITTTSAGWGSAASITVLCTET